MGGRFAALSCALVVSVSSCSSDEFQASPTTGGSSGAAGAPSGGAGGLDGAAGDGSAGTAGSDKTVTLTAIDTHYGETGHVDAPVDLSVLDVAALVYDDSSTTFANLTPTITGPGHASVSGIGPATTYYLRYSAVGSYPVYIVTSARTLDLGRNVLGRVDPVTSAPGTTLTLSVSNLAAWHSGDYLGVFAPNTGDGVFYAETLVSSGAPAENDTALAGFTLPWSGTLIDGGKGDKLRVLQLEPRAIAGGSDTYLSATRLFDAPLFSLGNGVNTTITGSFAPVSQDQDLSLDMKTSVFASVLAQGKPGASGGDQLFSLAFQPDASGEFLAGNTPDVVEYFPPDGDVVASFQHGKPVPKDWVGVAYGTAFANYPFSVQSHDSVLVARVTTLAPLAPSVTLKPLVGAPTAFQVAGKNAFTDLSSIGVTPHVSWQPPSSGTANGYRLDVWELGLSTSSGRAPAGTFYTTGTSLKIPPGMMNTGHTYAMVLTAIFDPTVDLAAQPLHRTIASGSAGVVSGTLVP